jgi:hypothetical protein
VISVPVCFDLDETLSGHTLQMPAIQARPALSGEELKIGHYAGQDQSYAAREMEVRLILANRYRCDRVSGAAAARRATQLTESLRIDSAEGKVRVLSGLDAEDKVFTGIEV